MTKVGTFLLLFPTGHADKSTGNVLIIVVHTEWKSRSKQSKRKQESAEEKKARKEAVKEERRAKRASKKELKNTFKSEGARMIRSTGNEQSTDHVSVFKYT